MNARILRKSFLLIIKTVAVSTVFLLCGVAGVKGSLVEEINFQGRLNDSQGSPVTGNKSITFTIYDSQTGGSVVKAAQSKMASLNSEGIFNVVLDISGIDLNQALWVEIRAGNETLTPRLAIKPAATAVFAAEAGAIEWGNIQNKPDGLGSNLESYLATATLDMNNYGIINTTITFADGTYMESTTTFLGVTQKASDADLFDGKDSSAFQLNLNTPTWQASDSAKLGGKDPSYYTGGEDNLGNHLATTTLNMAGYGIINTTITFADGTYMESTTTFLGVTQKASDADLFDGKDSSAFQLNLNTPTWQASDSAKLGGNEPSYYTGGEDNLGNHLATTTLNMAGYGIINTTITFTDGTYMASTTTFLGVTQKATDSDLLDGKDSSAFQLNLNTSTWQASDSAKLGGNDPSYYTGGEDNLGNHIATTTLNIAGFGIINATITFADGSYMESTTTFLGASQKAADSNLLDGQDGSYYAVKSEVAADTSTLRTDMDANSSEITKIKTDTGTLRTDMDGKQAELSTPTWTAADSAKLGGEYPSYYETAAADNLGNHTATTTLDMADNNLINVSSITPSGTTLYLSDSVTLGTSDSSPIVYHDTDKIRISTNTRVDGYLQIGGNLIKDSGGNIDVDNNKITSVGTPTLGSDAVTLSYATTTFLQAETEPKFSTYMSTSSSGVSISTHTTISGKTVSEQYLDDVDNTFISVDTSDSNFPTGSGTRLMWVPDKYAFRAGGVDSTQWDSGNIGVYSGSIGYKNKSSGIGSITMGANTEASGANSVAMGGDTKAIGNQSTAMGLNTTASGDYSTAMGRNTKAEAINAVAIGYEAIAQSPYSFALGVKSSATAQGAFAITDSQNTQFLVDAENAFGARFAGGYDFTGGTATFSNTVDVSDNRIINLSTPSADYDAATKKYVDDNASGGGGDVYLASTQTFTGQNTFENMVTVSSKTKIITAAGGGGAAEIGSSNNSATGNHAVAMGDYADASGITSVAMGYGADATGKYAVALGETVTASGQSSFVAGGNGSEATGDYAVALGRAASAIANQTLAYGQWTTASAQGSVALGDSDPDGLFEVSIPDAFGARFQGGYSLTGSGVSIPDGNLDLGGNYLLNVTSVTASGGPLNLSTTSVSGKLVVDGAAGFIGDVVTISTGTNALFRFDSSGEAYADGTWNAGGADYAEWYEKEEAVEAGDLVGMNPATGLARVYHTGDFLLGICSANPGFIGNSQIGKTPTEMEENYVLVGLKGQVSVNGGQVTVSDRIVKTADGNRVGVQLSSGKVHIDIQQ